MAISLILSFLIGAAAPSIVAVGMYRELLGTPDPEAEYYRGLYDVCVAQTRQREMCLKAVGGFRAKGWYEQESPGYEWPMPAPTGIGAPADRPDYPLQGS
ncbi:MAG: hypothetical protein BroJett011_03780 [Chloroflexota bacterium]|nr:MAG: hypothetical protein BroJett011_03780 [Chloroflexota bacterium]